MPTIARRKSSPFAAGNDLKAISAVNLDRIVPANVDFASPKRKLRSDATVGENSIDLPMKRKSPSHSVDSMPDRRSNEIENDSSAILVRSCKSSVKRLAESFSAESKWNPTDIEQINAVKEALHVSMAPSNVVCREYEQKRVLEFCKANIEHEKAGSIYVCGCPGTGKSLSMLKVKQLLVDWASEGGLQVPDILDINCTSLTKTSDIFSKILDKTLTQKKINGSTSSLQELQNLYSQKPQLSGMKMMLIIADELDYLITKDRAVIHDLFMLTTYPFSRCILLGIANAIDLADRFLPRLQSLNCKPSVVTFQAYSKDQICRVLQQRLMALPYIAFQPQAVELCARKVAAVSGDMRKALCVCRSAIEMLEEELIESTRDGNSSSPDKGPFDQQALYPDVSKAPENSLVRIDHMAVALSKTFKSPVVDVIQSLPQHQQIILCSAVKFFRGRKKDTTVGELNKFYMDFCKSVMIPPVGIMEFSSMCRVLNDQGLLKLGQSREDKLTRVTLKVDESDISFALQGVRFFRSCLQ